MIILERIGSAMRMATNTTNVEVQAEYGEVSKFATLGAT